MRRVVIYGLAMVLQASALRVQQFNEMQIRENYRGLAPLVQSFSARSARTTQVVLESTLDEPTARKQTASLIRNVGDDGSLLVASGDRGDFLGMAIVRSTEPPMLDVIAISPNARNKGAGRKLLREVERFAGKRGSKSIELEVEKFNVDGRRFFESCGFTESGQRKDLTVLTKAIRKPLPGSFSLLAVTAATIFAPYFFTATAGFQDFSRFV